MTRALLVVDDDPLIRRLVAHTLHDVADFEVHEAGDGLEAIEEANRRRPEIVLLDYDMPRLDGIETCRRMRSDPRTADATIIMLTAMAAAEARTRAEAEAPTCSSPSRSPRCTSCGSSTRLGGDGSRR